MGCCKDCDEKATEPKLVNGKIVHARNEPCPKGAKCHDQIEARSR